ncbi:hypothetical protein EDB85DRAFT_1388555 [Lactarius pseudohatsudake]|nr:hypothetical protein EDB85DRAFT_1388555 [Lactarius pseudohatsudake]
MIRPGHLRGLISQILVTFLRCVHARVVPRCRLGNAMIVPEVLDALSFHQVVSTSSCHLDYRSWETQQELLQ